ncbi:MAG: gamma-glutamyl-gamma-aminobutyrate hydrolase family protein [Planctomycetota bacterium]
MAASPAAARPRIGLVTYGRDERQWFGLPAAYVDAVRRAGGTPLLLPPGEGDLAGWLAAVDAVVLTGGGDMAPDTWGGVAHAENYKVDRDRDADELTLARRAVETSLPTLAICRGMQVLNVAFGGDLVAHVPDAFGDAVPHRSAEKTPIPHPVAVAADSRLARALGTTAPTVASWHHQAVHRIAAGFRATAHAPDGLVEAIERDGDGFLLAVQWHPELTAAADPAQQRLFDALVAAARSRASRR